MKRHQRNCGKPGERRRPDADADMAFLSASPTLVAMEYDRLLECPTGYVLRTGDWAYDALQAASCAQSAGFDLFSQSRFTQDCVRIVAAEVARFEKKAQQAKRAKRDAAHAARVLKARG